MPDQSAAPPSGESSRPARRRWALPFVLGLIGALVGILGYVVVADPNGSGEQTTATTRPTPTTRADPDSVKVYQKILPSLVFIEGRRFPFAGIIGSGVIVNDQGQILTALHVVDGLEGTIDVRFADGTTSPAHIVSTDPDHDIAVLESEEGPKLIVPAVLGGGIRVGDEAFAAGNPLELSNSLTAGVVSGLDRTITREDGKGELTGLIQFDAAVNPGSSGGPLLDRDGQVVGIVTALANPTGRNTFIGIGFAVPINTATVAAGGPDR
jgi:S1-C subfamily serine protease